MRRARGTRRSVRRIWGHATRWIGRRADDIDFGRLKKRHGAILPITEAEYEAIEDTFAN